MSTSETVLLVIDVPGIVPHRPYRSDSDVPSFVERLQALIDGAKFRKIPVAQIFHVEDSEPFSLASGYVVSLAELSFHKRRHSALIGSGLDVWLVQHGIRRLIVNSAGFFDCEVHSLAATPFTAIVAAKL